MGTGNPPGVPPVPPNLGGGGGGGVPQPPTPDQQSAINAGAVIGALGAIPGGSDIAEIFLSDAQPTVTGDPSIAGQAHDAGAQVFQSLRSLGVPRPLAWLGSVITFVGLGVLHLAITIIVWVVSHLGAQFADAIVSELAKFREKGTPEIDKLVSDSLIEFFGSEMGTIRASSKPMSNQPLERAREIGPALMGLLKKEFLFGQTDTIQPSFEGAETFLGFNVDFSIYTALLGLIGEVSSFGFATEIRELGANIAENLGLGRLARRALMPIMKIAVEDPQTWALNKQYRPALLPEPQAVSAFLSGDMNADDFHETMARLGYSTNLINVLIAYHQRRLANTDVERLVRYGVWTEDQGVAYIQAQGFTADMSKVALLTTELQRVDAVESELAKLLRQRFVDGFITADTFNATLRTLHLAPGELSALQSSALAEQAMPRKALSVAQIQHAYENNIIDDSAMAAEFLREGYSPDDADTLHFLTLLAAAKLDAASAAKLKAARKAARTAVPPAATPPPTASGG